MSPDLLPPPAGFLGGRAGPRHPRPPAGRAPPGPPPPARPGPGTGGGGWAGARTRGGTRERAVALSQAPALPVTPVRSGRAGARGPLIERTGPGELVARTAQAVATLHAERLGRIAVIADEERLPSLVATLRSQQGLPAVGAGSAGVDDEIAVMTAQDAKGLEFDAVVIVEPAELIDAHGAGGLYVAMSRSTQHLGIVHARELPAGIAD